MRPTTMSSAPSSMTARANSWFAETRRDPISTNPGVTTTRRPEMGRLTKVSRDARALTGLALNVSSITITPDAAVATTARLATGEIFEIRDVRSVIGTPAAMPAARAQATLVG